MQPQWEKKSRFLTQLLIWSGALNIGLFSSLVYVVFKDRPETIAFELKPAGQTQTSQVTNQEILTTYSTLSWAELIAELESDTLIEEGYKKKDLALASLVAFHGLDIERAVQGVAIQRRGILLPRKEGPEEINIVLYPGLTEDQFGAIRRFIQTERFPFTALGLFYELQQAKPPRDTTLLEAFYLTPEFNAIVTLCQRSGVNLPKEFIIEMIAQGDWKTLHQFEIEQKEAMDLTPERLKKLLLSYVKCRSTLAAKILLQWDRAFILKRLDDQELAQFLALFDETSQPLKELLKELATSPRSDVVVKKANEMLGITAEPIAVVAVAKQVDKSVEQKHQIASGDSLWKIARKYKVSIEAIRAANHLESDKLREGRTLIIPTGSSKE